jgi:hypothetical protein
MNYGQVSGEFLFETEKAIEIEIDGETYWVPRSFCNRISKSAPKPQSGKVMVEIEVEAWWIRQNDLEDESS